jgi:hypothetical protein
VVLFLVARGIRSPVTMRQPGHGIGEKIFLGHHVMIIVLMIKISHIERVTHAVTRFLTASESFTLVIATAYRFVLEGSSSLFFSLSLRRDENRDFSDSPRAGTNPNFNGRALVSGP